MRLVGVALGGEKEGIDHEEFAPQVRARFETRTIPPLAASRLVAKPQAANGNPYGFALGADEPSARFTAHFSPPIRCF